MTFAHHNTGTWCLLVLDSAYVLSREREKLLRTEIDQFLQSKLGQECVLDLIQFVKDWIEDNIAVLSSSPPPSSSCSRSSSPQVVHFLVHVAFAHSALDLYF